MALDLSMKSHRRLGESSRSSILPPPGLLPDHDAPLALVTRKRVRFAPGSPPPSPGSVPGPDPRGRTAVNPFHPYGRKPWRKIGLVPVLMKEGMNEKVGDSDEENRPPSSSSSDSSLSPSPLSMDIESGTIEDEVPHPAARVGHMTLPVRIEASGSIHSIPSDPREWTRSDVSKWLHFMKVTHNLSELLPERFPMNGKALCLMNANMFAYRVPNGGKILFRDFRTRLSRVLAIQSAATSALPAVSMTTATSSCVTPPAQA